MAFLRRNLPKMAVWDVEIFIGRNLSYNSKSLLLQQKSPDTAGAEVV